MPEAYRKGCRLQLVLCCPSIMCPCICRRVLRWNNQKGSEGEMTIVWHLGLKAEVQGMKCKVQSAKCDMRGARFWKGNVRVRPHLRPAGPTGPYQPLSYSLPGLSYVLFP